MQLCTKDINSSGKLSPGSCPLPTARSWLWMATTTWSPAWTGKGKIARIISSWILFLSSFLSYFVWARVMAKVPDNFLLSANAKHKWLISAESKYFGLDNGNRLNDWNGDWTQFLSTSGSCPIFICMLPVIISSQWWTQCHLFHKLCDNIFITCLKNAKLKNETIRQWRTTKHCEPPRTVYYMHVLYPIWKDMVWSISQI